MNAEELAALRSLVEEMPDADAVPSASESPCSSTSPIAADDMLQRILDEGHAEPELAHASPRLRREELELLLRRADEALGSPRNSISESPMADHSASAPAPSSSDATVGHSDETSRQLSFASAVDADGSGGSDGNGSRPMSEALRGIAAAEQELRSLSNCGDRQVISPLRERAQHGSDRRQRLGLLKLETLEGINETLQTESNVRTSGRSTAIALHPLFIAVGTSFGQASLSAYPLPALVTPSVHSSYDI